MRTRLFAVLAGLTLTLMAATSARANQITYDIVTPQSLSDGGSISGYFTFDPVAWAFGGVFHIETGVGSDVTSAHVYDSGIGCAGGLDINPTHLICDLGDGDAFSLTEYGPQGDPAVYFPFLENADNWSQYRLGGLTPTPYGGSASILTEERQDQPDAVPEPSTLFLLGAGVFGIGAKVRKAQRAKSVTI